MRNERRGRRDLAAVATGLVVLAACSPAGAGTRAEVPEGTALTVRLDQTLTTERHGAGTAFTATVSRAVTGDEGRTLVPEGASVRGEVAEFTEDPPRLRLVFEEIEIGAETHLLEAELVSVTPRSHSEMVDEGAKIGGGAAAGALLGGVIGGGAKEAVIGAAAGAAAGTGAALATKKRHAYLPAGSLLRLELRRPLVVRVEEGTDPAASGAEADGEGDARS